MIPKVNMVAKIRYKYMVKQVVVNMHVPLYLKIMCFLHVKINHYLRIDMLSCPTLTLVRRFEAVSYRTYK